MHFSDWLGSLIFKGTGKNQRSPQPKMLLNFLKYALYFSSVIEMTVLWPSHLPVGSASPLGSLLATKDAQPLARE